VATEVSDDSALDFRKRKLEKLKSVQKMTNDKPKYKNQRRGVSMKSDDSLIFEAKLFNKSDLKHSNDTKMLTEETNASRS
jgi:hypothetical protein